jgi:hypothetical protein
MATKRIGQRVKILGGMAAFVGKTGEIVEIDKSCGRAPYYRVRLDEAVEIPWVGFVRDDIWQGHLLRNVKG